jgi:2,4-dienoyl-CoA reductase (NADPH2)
MNRLFSSIKVGSLELKNRIVMLPMHLGYAPDGFASDRLIRFYRDRAEGGAGLIIVGGAHVHKAGSGGLHFMAVDDDKYVPGLKKLAGAIREGGSKSALQLFHSGRYAYAMLTGEQPVSASEVKSPLSGDVPRALSIEEIRDVIALFTDGAHRAREAGFDAVEIIGSTGYLVSQFLSPNTNLRTDEYGGSLENRMRFGIELVKNIKKELDEEYPLIFRLSFDDLVEGGTSLAETRKIAKGLEEAGVDCIDMQVGWHESRVPTTAMQVPQAAFAYLAREIKKQVAVPITVTNRISDPIRADELLQDGVADLIGMARPLIADPEWPNKAGDGRIDEIAPCIACNQGCMDGVFMGRPSTCLVNPAAGREEEFEIKPAQKKKKVMVIGGGPGGMEAARVLAIRGHEVSLYEKEESLGGQLKICGAAQDRREFKKFLKFLIAEVNRLDINICTGAEVTEQTVLDTAPDAVIVATGARQEIPELPGIDKQHVFTAEALLKREADLGEKAVIIGGGHIGCEAALFVAQRGLISVSVADFLAAYGALKKEEAVELNAPGRSITIIEERKKIAAYYGRSSRWALMGALRNNDVEMITNTKVIKINDGNVEVETDGEKKTIDADTVIVTSGYVEENGLHKKLEGRVPELHVIGDARKLKSLQNAVFEAAKTAREI